MRSVQVREAKAKLSALIEAAERGSPTTITKHGKAAAVLVPVEVAEAHYTRREASFGAHLLAFPGRETFERPEGALRDIDL